MADVAPDKPSVDAQEGAPSERESDAEWEAFMDATQTVLKLKAGVILRHTDVAAIEFVSEYERRDQERQTDCFRRGYKMGLEEGGGKSRATLIEERSVLESKLAVSKALHRFAEQRGFRLGAQACREMMASFVEQGGDYTTAQSIRANWNPAWGDDPGLLTGGPSTGQDEA